MSEYAELVGTNAAAWRAHVEGLVVERNGPLEARMDELQNDLARQDWYVANGHEVEFVLAAREGVTPPDRRQFYETFVERISRGETPREVAKGQMVDPFVRGAPILVCKEGDQYLWETEAAGTCMEVVTRPSTDWRESLQRYWDVLDTLGTLAAEYGCQVQVLATHMSTSMLWSHGRGLGFVRHIEGDGKLLVAMQEARRALQPLEPYMSLLRRPAETYPSKAALWHVGSTRVETRYPGFGVVDTRLQMLGALAGAKQAVYGEKEFDLDVVHPCESLGFSSEKFPEVGVLTSILVWDKKEERMVLPETITRGSMLGATTISALTRLDQLVHFLTVGKEKDGCADNARVLRQAIGALSVGLSDDGRGGSLKIDEDHPFRLMWKVGIRVSKFFSGPAVRLAVPGVQSTGSYKLDRERAAKSSEVQAILGKRALASLTAPAKAERRRDNMVLTQRLNRSGSFWRGLRSPVRPAA